MAQPLPAVGGVTMGGIKPLGAGQLPSVDSPLGMGAELPEVETTAVAAPPRVPQPCALSADASVLDEGVDRFEEKLTDLRVLHENGQPEQLDYGSPIAAGRPPSPGPLTPPRPLHTAAAPVPATPVPVVQGQALSREEVLKAQREIDVRSAFAGLPKIRPHLVTQYMKILLVGEDGLGRTTFTRNLFAAYVADPNISVRDASVPHAKKVFRDDPSQLCTEITLQDPDHKIEYHYLVQDTPGYGDSHDLEADRRAILDYIQQCSCQYLQQELAPDRKGAMHTAKDPRVDVCLYFIPPHRLRQIDLEFMRALAAHVPVVPVLAKADTMTGDELREFRHRVRSALQRAGGGAMWHFSHVALEEAGARHGPPFAVIGSNCMDLATGRFWPVRRYAWGTCEGMLSTHSDLTVLRRLLFESAYNEIKEATEARYHAFRKARASPGGPVRAAASHLLRSLATVGGMVVAVWLVVNTLPVLKDEVRRKETVRRVKDKVKPVVPPALQPAVGEAVEGAVEAAESVTGVAKSTTAAAAATTKRVASETGEKVKAAAQALETEETRKWREEEEAKKRRKKGILPFSWFRG